MGYKLYELIDKNRGGIYHDFTDGNRNRKSWWALQPYSVSDRYGDVNENFVNFVESKENNIVRRPIFNLMTLVEEYNKAISNFHEYLNKAKNPQKFARNLVNLQEYLIEQKAVDKFIVIKEDGSVLRSTRDSIGRDDFPPYDNKTTEPSIENNLDANSHMYNEDLEYNHVLDATKDQYEMSEERKKAWIPGSKAVTVKQKCRLGGKGDGTSVACNQGDVSNLKFSSLKEEVKLDQGFVDGWHKYEILHNGDPAGEMEVSNRGDYMILNKIMIYPEHRGMGHANDAMKILTDYADKNNEILALTPDTVWGASKGKLIKWYKSWGFTINKGRKADYKVREMMIRQPQRQNLNEVTQGGEYSAYHGSDHKIDKFSDEFVGAEEATDQEGPGIYFTTSYDDAQGYGTYLYSVRLSPQKLVDESSHEDISNEELENLIKMSPDWEMTAQNWDEDAETGLQMAIEDFKEYNESEKELFQQIWIDFFRYNPIEFVRGMVNLAYDGQIIQKEDDRKHVIVYNPNIIEIEKVEKVPLSEKYFRRIGERKGYTKKAIDEFVKRHFGEKKTKLEGVGDKYLEKKYNIPSEFSSFEKKFNVDKLDNKIIYQNKEGWGIVENPNSFKNIGPNVRGIITKSGDLYVETYSNKIHDKIVDILRQKGIVNTPFHDALEDTLPQEYLSVQRYADTNKILVGESNDVMQDDFWMSDNWREDFDIPSKEEAEPVFKRFLDAAKMKNPNIEFVNEHIQVYKRNEHGISENVIVENEIMSLQDLPFKKDIIDGLGGKIYSVGGAVRDEFLGKESKDLDILIAGVPMGVLEQVLSKYGKVDAVGKSFGILKFKPEGSSEEIDIAIPRTEKATGEGGHKGFEVSSDHELPIEKDLERRDFTINAIAKDIEGNIIDPFGGKKDLRNKIIRVVNPEAFVDDPLRMLRAIQFGARFGFKIEPQTMQMIRDNAERIKEIPSERILTEFDKIVNKGNMRTGAQLLKDSGLFKEIFGFDIKQSTIDRSPFENVGSMAGFIYLLTRMTAEPADHYKNNLKGDVDTYKEIKALNYGMENVSDSPVKNRSVAHNMYLYSPKSLKSKILPSKLESAAMELLMGRFPKTVGELAINGNDLMQLGLQGKEIGDKLKSLLINVYAENVDNKRENLLSLVGNKSQIK